MATHVTTTPDGVSVEVEVDHVPGELSIEALVRNGMEALKALGVVVMAPADVKISVGEDPDGNEATIAVSWRITSFDE